MIRYYCDSKLYKSKVVKEDFQTTLEHPIFVELYISTTLLFLISGQSSLKVIPNIKHFKLDISFFLKYEITFYRL